MEKSGLTQNKSTHYPLIEMLYSFESVQKFPKNALTKCDLSRSEKRC